jgi:hypothetical protein
LSDRYIPKLKFILDNPSVELGVENVGVYSTGVAKTLKVNRVQKSSATNANICANTNATIIVVINGHVTQSELRIARSYSTKRVIVISTSS